MSPRITVAQALYNGKQELEQSSETPRLDSQLLLLHAINSTSANDEASAKTITWLLTWPETLLTEVQIHAYRELLSTRAKGKPVAYITNAQGFWSFDLKVTADTLIPRPETELLVECALEKIPDSNRFSILELGTGSGAIALALAAEKPASHILATDISRAALEIAEYNADQLELKNIHFKHSSWFESIASQKFDVIVSNPPYIPEEDPHLQQPCLQYEPELSLSSGSDGLEALRIIIRQSQRHLHRGGWLLLEHGYDQKQAVQSLLKAERYTHIATVNDLNQQPRVSMARKYAP